MAILFMDGFEKNSLDKWVVSNGSVASASGKDFSGSYCLDVSGYGGNAKAVLSTSQSEIYIQYRVRFTGTSGGGYSEFRDSTAAVVLTVRRINNHLVALRGGTTLGTSTKVLMANTTYLIKMYYKPLNSGGQITIYIDDMATAEISYSGDTTASNENVQSFNFGGADDCYMYVDDFVMSTTDITKNLRILGRAPNGAGTTTQWDPSTGANYECVDEIPPTSTDYTSTNTTDEIDTFAIADCTEDINSISAVQVELYVAKEGSPTPTHVRPVIRASGTDYPSGVDLSPSVSFSTQFYIWELNPADSAAFEEADINGLEIGYKATA